MSFVHLQVHSEYSISDGLVRLPQLVTSIAENHMEAVAITDDSNLYAAVKFYKAAVKAGIIDCIATDHAPHAIEDKEKDMHHAPCGMIGLESAFGLVNKTLKKTKMSTKSIIDLFTINPSKILNIKPNAIKEGNIAEINIINPDCRWVFEKHEFSDSVSASWRPWPEHAEVFRTPPPPSSSARAIQSPSVASSPQPAECRQIRLMSSPGIRSRSRSSGCPRPSV